MTLGGQLLAPHRHPRPHTAYGRTGQSRQASELIEHGSVF